MVLIDPVTRQRIVTAKHTGDITYDLVGDTAITEEDVPLIGPWEDWTGSNFNPMEVNSRNLQLFAGQENLLEGTDSAIMHGAKLNQLTDTGERTHTHRKRIIKRYAKLDGHRRFE